VYTCNFAQASHSVERSYAHPEKLIQVIGKDAKETQPVVDVVGRILCFLQYACIERQPADVPYDGLLGRLHDIFF
jgi:hypothetical protein